MDRESPAVSVELEVEVLTCLAETLCESQAMCQCLSLAFDRLLMLFRLGGVLFVCRTCLYHCTGPVAPECTVPAPLPIVS